MKKEILELVSNQNSGYFRINNISVLHRWTKNGIGDKVDELALNFDNINGVNFSPSSIRIKSRDYDGIIAECEEATRLFISEVTKSLCKDLRAGYRNKKC